nr:MAG TPA: hypothetical protein [Crassvirales sp.]
MFIKCLISKYSKLFHNNLLFFKILIIMSINDKKEGKENRTLQTSRDFYLPKYLLYISNLVTITPIYSDLWV